MQISHEETGTMTATIKIEIEPADYQENVDKVLREHRRKASMPGFRPGMVPMGMIKRMYGKAVMAEEVQKLLAESLDTYISDKQLEIIGQPLSSEEHNERIDFDNQTSFTFYFDIGLSPKLDIEINDKIDVTYHTIAVDDAMLEDYINDMRNRHGEWMDVDPVKEEDTVKGGIVELNDEGEPKQGGISKQTTLAVHFLKEPSVKDLFIGKSVGDQVVFNPMKATTNATETATMLGIKKEEAENLTSVFRFTIDQITHLEPAELNTEFFHHMYPSEHIDTAEDFRERVRKDVEDSFTADCDRQFMNSVMKTLTSQAQIELPDAFLKRFLLANNEDKLTREDIEKDYEKYARSMRWQLIENKMIKDHQVQVTENEIRDYIHGYFESRFNTPHHDHEHNHEHDHDHQHEHDSSSGHESAEGKTDQARLNSLVDYVMKNEEEVRKINDHLFDKKLRDLFKSKLNVSHKQVSFNEFVALSSNPET